MNRFNKDYQFSTLPYLHNIIGFIGYFNSFNTPSEYPPINLLLAIFLELSNKAVSFCTSKKTRLKMYRFDSGLEFILLLDSFLGIEQEE